MKKAIATIVLLTSMCICVGYSFAGDGQDENKKAMGSAEDMMKMAAWAKMAEPGEHHAHLKQLEGTWKTTTKFWMGPGDPQISQGSCKNEWILGGRFLAMDFKSTSQEHPFEGHGLLGYDNAKKQHVSVWCDTMSTMVGVSYGTSDDSGKVFTYTSTYDDPMTGQTKKMKLVTTVINDDKHVFTIHNIDKDGKEHQELEVTYVRAS